ncbi:hypothetical protein IQ07DRAFT_370235 [Pyrenochaeta sp. DS3sAY3a]|nr:hypothetical protein IQ07DRAFT_370235 [Pyrenochaeta sp. DS3sAY3a]
MLHSAIPNRASTSDETDAMRKVGRDQNFGDGRAEDAANKVGQLQEKERRSESRQAESRGANGDMLFDSTWRRSRTCERRKEGGRDWARRAPQRDGRSGDTEGKINSRLAAMAPAGMRNNSQRRAKVFQSRQAGADQTGARRERGLVESKDGLVSAGVGRSLGWLGRMQIWAWHGRSVLNQQRTSR